MKDKSNTWNFFICVRHWKNHPKKSCEKHSNVNPKTLTTSFAVTRAQFWREPLTTITQMSFVIAQDEPDYWFFHPSFEEGISRQVPGLAAATRSEPQRPLLWGLSCAVVTAGTPFAPGNSFILRSTTCCLVSPNEQLVCWLAFAAPFVCGPRGAIRLITSDLGAAHLSMGPQWWRNLWHRPWDFTVNRAWQCSAAVALILEVILISRIELKETFLVSHPTSCTLPTLPLPSPINLC